MSNTAHAKQVCKPKKLPFVIMCILSAIVAVLNVLLCVLVPKYYTTINSFLYKGPDADEVAAFRQASADMTQKVESEGIVMLENKNQTLPLASGSKINLFGYGSRDTVYGGSGSGSGDSSNNITLEQGLTNAGFSVNPELVSFYNDHFVERVGVGFTGNNFDINEPAVNEYSDEMIANAKAYSDVAVFVVSRLGGEGADLPMDMDPNATTHIVSSGKDIEQVVKGGDAGKHYLELQSVEQQVLDMLKENFGTVVVLVNSTNAMELGFLEDEGVDAALWIGCLGSTGANAVGEVLSGAVNPSGRTTDTFAYAVESAPSYYSIGAYNYTNCEWVNTNPIGGGAAPDFYHYVDYIEGIYVGYRYYETAAEDGFIDYDATVQYPFGYGLSYTDFEESISDFSFDGNNVTMTVNVKNNGCGADFTAGRHAAVVERPARHKALTACIGGSTQATVHRQRGQTSCCTHSIDVFLHSPVGTVRAVDAPPFLTARRQVKGDSTVAHADLCRLALRGNGFRSGRFGRRCSRLRYGNFSRCRCGNRLWSLCRRRCRAFRGKRRRCLNGSLFSSNGKFYQRTAFRRLQGVIGLLCAGAEEHRS